MERTFENSKSKNEKLETELEKVRAHAFGEMFFHVLSRRAQNGVLHSPSSFQNFLCFFHFSLCKQWQFFKSFTSASCRIIYFANILYLGRGISKRKRAFSGFSLCECLVGIWVNYNFVPGTWNVLSHSSK